MRPWTTLILLSAALLPTACATAPPVSEPAAGWPEIPEAWTTAAPGPESTDSWWTAFGQPGLDQLVAEALERNHDLQTALAAVDAALVQARLAGAELRPGISAGVDASSRQQVFVGLPIPGQSGPLKTRSDSFGASVNVSWEADLWGRLRAGRRAAVQDAEAARADYAAVRQSIAAQTAKAWLALVEAERQVDLAAATVESRHTTTERVEARYRHGVASPLDVRLARSNEAQAASSLEARRRQLDATRRQLEVLVGRYPSGRVSTDDDLVAVPAGIPGGLPAELVTRRPDLVAAERRLRAAGWRVAEARAAFYPHLSLSASGGTTSDRVGDLLDGDFSVWSLAGGLLQPIFQGGRLRAAAELAASRRDQSLADYAQRVLRAFAEVETALAAESLLAAEEAALRDAAEEGRAAVRLAEDRYGAGVGDYLSILESQRQVFASDSRLLSVRRERLTNRIDLHVALGGGFFSAGSATGPETEDASESETVPATGSGDRTPSDERARP